MKDLRHALRTMGRSPGFAALAIATLALGIGANVAIFTAVDAVLFRSLAVREPASLVRVYATDVEGTDLSNSSYPAYTDYRDQTTSFAGVAAFDDAEPLHLSTGGRSERLTGAVVSGNFFDVLGVRAERGRLFSAADDRTPGGHPVAVVSDRLWKGRFGGSDSAVGAAVQINGHPFTIVGVAPRGFTGVNLDSLPDLWVPLAMVDQALPDLAASKVLTTRNLSFLDVVARLKPGVPLSRAQAELDALTKNRAASEPEDRREPMTRLLKTDDVAVGPGSRGEARRISWLLFGMAGLVLLIACADAAALLLLRSERRRREIGVRLAVGASRRQIARQVLVESLLVASLAAVAGVLVAVWATDLLAAAVPPEFALPIGAALPIGDPRVLGFAAFAAFASVLLFGLLPALRAGRVDVVASLKGTPAGGGRSRLTLRDALVAGQMALTAILLVGAGLLAHTLVRESTVDPGFEPSGRLEASADLARQGYDRSRGMAFFEEAVRRVGALPGVTSAALARSTPVQSAGMRTSIESDGYTAAPGEVPQADLNIVSPRFFRTLGIKLAAGRDFDDRDRADGPAVAIVSESMARKFWPGKNPIGRRIMNLGPEGVGAEVIGVVRDVRARSLRRLPDPTVYAPVSQFYMPRMTIVLSTDGDAAALQRPLVEALASMDAGLPLFHVRTLSDKLGLSLGQGRLLALLVATFAGLALLLAAAGLYGVVSYATQTRTREFGIRLALGASARSVRGLVLSRTGAITLAGLGAGLAVAAAASRLAAQLLFGVSPLDPLSYLAAAALLGAVALAASAVPARRASRVPPSISLRSE
jgi:predicted permease